MKKEDIWDYPLSEPPVALLDGAIGLLTVCPTKDEKSVLCGIQVPGEEEHRWYHHEHIHRIGDSLCLVAVGKEVIKK